MQKLTPRRSLLQVRYLLRRQLAQLRERLAGRACSRLLLPRRLLEMGAGLPKRGNLLAQALDEPLVFGALCQRLLGAPRLMLKHL